MLWRSQLLKTSRFSVYQSGAIPGVSITMKHGQEEFVYAFSSVLYEVIKRKPTISPLPSSLPLLLPLLLPASC